MCSQGPNEGNYEFFEKIEDYIEIAKSAEGITSFPQAKSGCNSFMHASERYFTDKEKAEIICKQFIKLYVSLKDVTCVRNEDPKYIKCSEFLNYWVNFKFRKIMQNEDDSLCDIYQGIEGQFSDNSDININMYYEYIYDINEDDLHKMNILYSLYEKYIDLRTILESRAKWDKASLLSLSTACCTDYLKANYICKDENNKFCTELKKFETKYKGIYDTVDGKGPEYTNNFKRLTQCDNNTVSTALIGTTVGLVPLLVGLYKFTPLRQLINSNKGKLAQAYRNNDDKLTNIMLMDQQNEQTTSQQERYNIKYHSL